MKINFKNILINKNVKLLLGALVLFVGVMAFVPSASVVRAFPVLPVASVLAFMICKDRKTTCLLSFVLTTCMYCVYGFSVIAALLYGALSAVVTLLSVSVLCALVSSRKCAKKSGTRARRIRFLLLLLVTLSLYCLVCSDPVSTLSAHEANSAYVRESYGGSVKITHTYYSLSDFDFRTCVEFEDDGARVGHDREVYVNVTQKGVYDGVREYYEEKLLENSEKALSSVVSGATDAYDVLYSDIVFSDGELLPDDAKSEDYFDRTNYVVGLYSIIENKHDFERLVTDCAKALLSSDTFDFESVTFCAGTADEALYSVSITPKTTASEISDLVRDFDSKNVELFGVTQKDFLSYWN